jgi:hypothetical protein
LDTPPHELQIARDLQTSILSKPVKVIALGRFRAFTTKSPWTLSEHILMEVYSEAGDFIWANPFIGMSLEEAINKLVLKEPLHARANPVAAWNEVVPGKRQQVEAEMGELVSKGLSAEEIQTHLARTRGLELKVASRLYDRFIAREEPSSEVQIIIRHFAEQLKDYYSGEEFFVAVSEDSGQSLDMVRTVLSETPRRGQGAD